MILILFYHPINTMIGLKMIVFFLGTTIVSCRVLRTGPYGRNSIKYGKPTFSMFPRNSPFVPEMQPIFKPFMQQHTNLFYKPQFMMPSKQFLPFVNKNERNSIQTPKFPYIVQDPEIFMSQPIETPRESIIEYVVPATSERAQEPIPCNQTKLNEPSTLIHVPVAPELQPLPALPPVIVEEAFTPEPPTIEELMPIVAEIPEAPALPPLSIPELPGIAAPVEIQPLPELPYITVEETFEPEFSTIEELISTSEIPEAPVLPPFFMPDLPEILEPTAPELPPLPEISSITINEIPEPAPVIVELSAHEIPEAPVLPNFVMPELPSLETLTSPELFSSTPEQPSQSISCITQEVQQVQPEDIAIFQAPLEIPEAPVLPEFQMSAIPVNGDIVTGPVEIISEPISEASAPEIPGAPVLPNFVMPELPSLETLTSPELFPFTPEEPSQSLSQAPLENPEAPVLTEYQMPAIQIIEHPANGAFETISKPQESLGHVEIPEAPILPALSLLESPEPVILEISKEVPEKLELPITQTPVIQEPTFVEIHSEQPCEHTENIRPTEVIDESRPILNHPLHLPGYLPYPAFFAQNIIIERVVPNMIFNVDKIPVNDLPYFTNQAEPMFEESLSDV